MLVWVDTCQKATSLESSFVTCTFTCTGLNMVLRKRKVRRSVWVLSVYGISCRTEIYRHTDFIIFTDLSKVVLLLWSILYLCFTLMLSCLLLATLWSPVNLMRLVLLNMLFFNWPFHDGISFVDRFLLFMFHVCLCYMLYCLLLAALWSPAEKGFTSWISCVWYFLVFCHFPIWFHRSGVVLDFIDSWYLLSSLL